METNEAECIGCGGTWVKYRPEGSVLRCPSCGGPEYGEDDFSF